MLTATTTQTVTIPMSLKDCRTDVERALYYIALKDRFERKRASDNARRNSGVCWSGMSGGSNYVGKTDEEMVAEAVAKVSMAVAS